MYSFLIQTLYYFYKFIQLFTPKWNSNNIIQSVIEGELSCKKGEFSVEVVMFLCFWNVQHLVCKEKCFTVPCAKRWVWTRKWNVLLSTLLVQTGHFKNTPSKPKTDKASHHRIFQTEISSQLYFVSFVSHLSTLQFALNERKGQTMILPERSSARIVRPTTEVRVLKRYTKVSYTSRPPYRCSKEKSRPAVGTNPQ